MRKILVPGTILFLFCTLPVFSLSAERLEALLAQERVSYQEAVELVLEAAEVSATDATDMYSFALEKNWLPRNTEPNNTVSLEGLSFLMMNAFDIKGGAFYSLFKNPHYAYRELVYKNIIQGRVAPKSPVTGELLLFMISRILVPGTV